MVVGPPLPLPFETIPVDIQGVESVRTSKDSAGGTNATASVLIGDTTLTVSSSQGSTKNTTRFFNVQTQVFPDISSSILMTMDGLASTSSGGGKAGGTVSASAEIDPYIYIDEVLFAAWYPGIDPGLYSVLVNSEFVNIPVGPTATPLPGAIWLFGSGLAGVAAVGRRHRKWKALSAA